MLDRLVDIYLPLIGWTMLGLVLLRSLPNVIPKLMGRSLYWVGVPLQVLAFMQRSELTITVWLVPIIVILSLLLGFVASLLLCWQLPKEDKGDVLLAAMLGNTGFVGLAITPYLIDDKYLSWVVLFSLVHNVVGSYGLGVAIASYYGQHSRQVDWKTHLKSVVTTPSLWAFSLGLWLQLKHIELGEHLAQGLQTSVQLIVPVALLLVGIRLKQVKNWHSLNQALPAASIKLILLPLAVGVAMTLGGITGTPRLAMVLQAGMPTALAGVILAEEYDLRQEAIILSIAMTSLGVLATIPLWLWLFPA